MDALVLAVRPESAAELLDGKRRVEHRRMPPRRLPARAYMAVSGTGTVIGECLLDPPERKTAQGWALPVREPRRYARPRPLSAYGLEKIPRSFRYLRRATRAKT